VGARDDADREPGYRRGAALLSLGIGASGVLTYAYFALASHELGPDDYGALTVLWSVLFISVVTLYRPVEQFVSHSIASGMATGHEYRSSIRVAGSIQVLLAVGYVGLLLALRGTIEDDLIQGESYLYLILLIAAPAYAVSFFARGYLAGSGRFGLYGSMLLLEASSRFAMAAIVTVGIAGGMETVAFGILVAPLLSLAVVPLAALRGRRPAPAPVDIVGEEPESPVAAGTSFAKGGKFVGSAFLVMLSEQTLLNAGVLIVAAKLDAAAAGMLFNVMLVARAPQVLFGAVTTSLLPSLSRHWATRHRDAAKSFYKDIRDTVLAIAGFTGALVLLVAVAGPGLMALTFGGDHSYDRLGLVLVATGLGFHLTALTLTQGQLARDRAPVAAAAWAGCAIGFIAFVLLPIGGEVRQAELGYLVAAAALSVALYLQLGRWSFRSRPLRST
jgi:O-antigen/teichoic acid export membrane protein